MNALPDYVHALERAVAVARPLDTTEMCPISSAAGRVLADAIVADRDLPPFDRAQMDGYAVAASDFAGQDTWPVHRVLPAGASADFTVPPGTCVAIATGAALPAGVDAVVPHEQSDRGDPVRFTVDSVASGSAVHPRGADAAAGDQLVAAGTVLAAQHIGIAATVGAAEARVRVRPRAVVLTSGDEVVENGVTPAAHQIRNSNGPMLTELLSRCGAAPIEHHHVIDEIEPTRDAVAAALDNADLVITVGGISAGDRDHFPTAFAALGVELAVHGATIQPGKPVIVGHRAAGGAVVVGLPGNPVSSLACACLFAWPIVRVLAGRAPSLPWREVTLDEAVKPNPRRRAFRPAAVVRDGVVRVPTWAGSGDLAHTAGTDGLVELPVQDKPVAAGSRLRFLPWPSNG